MLTVVLLFEYSSLQVGVVLCVVVLIVTVSAAIIILLLLVAYSRSSTLSLSVLVAKPIILNAITVVVI